MTPEEQILHEKRNPYSLTQKEFDSIITDTENHQLVYSWELSRSNRTPDMIYSAVWYIDHPIVGRILVAEHENNYNVWHTITCHETKLDFSNTCLIKYLLTNKSIYVYLLKLINFRFNKRKIGNVFINEFKYVLEDINRIKKWHIPEIVHSSIEPIEICGLKTKTLVCRRPRDSVLHYDKFGSSVSYWDKQEIKEKYGHIIR